MTPAASAPSPAPGPAQVSGPGPGAAASALAPLGPVPRTSDALLGFAAGMGGTLVGMLAGVVPALLWEREELVVVGVLLAGVLGLGGLWWVLGRRAGWSLADIGFRRSRSHHAHLLWQVPLVFVANLVLTLLLAVALGQLGAEPLAPDGSQTEAEGTGEDPLLGLGGGVRWWLVLPGALMVGVVLPLVEEIVFRRLLLDWLGSWLPMLVAGVIVAVLFAVMHVLPPAMLYIGGLGAGMLLLRWWHGTIWAPLVLHVVNNLLVASLAVGAALA